MNKTLKKVLKTILIIVIVLLVAVVLFIGYLTVTEYKPEATETLNIEGSSSKTLAEGDDFTIMTWNMGYAGLAGNADFFMDGGEHVRSCSESQVNDNIDAVVDQIEKENADVVFLQEVDRNSKRSYKIDEFKKITSSLTDYSATYGCNYKVAYVPYPLPTIGKVDCGIATLSAFNVDSSERVSLPCPFKYPIRLGNLKRCLMVNRVAIDGTDKELVLVNLHLEAYDDGEGKIAQTKQLKELLEDEAAKGNYVIAGGDFNQSFSNYDNSAYPLISEDMWQPGAVDVDQFDDSLSFITDNSTPSCRSLDRPLAGNDSDPSVFQYYMIDGFIVSDNLTINTVETRDLGFKNSDHNPIVMNVTVTK